MINSIKIKTVCVMCCLFVFSCNEKEIPDAIKIDNNVENIMLSEIVDSVTVMPLETTDECLIGYINEIRYANGHYHLYDHRNKSIFTFDEKGKFVKTFHKHGQGPGEYLVVSGFRFDADGFLHLLDNVSNKILKYDYKTDSLLANIRIDRDNPRNFTCLENKYLLYMRGRKVVRQGIYTFDPDEQNSEQKYKKIIEVGEWTHEYMMNSHISDMQNLDYVVADNISGSKVYEMRADSIIKRYDFVGGSNFEPGNKKLYGYHLVSCIKAGDIITLEFIYIDSFDKNRNMPLSDNTKDIRVFFNIKTGKYKSFHKIEYEDKERIYIYHSAKNKFILIREGKTDKKGFELNPEMHILHLKENFLD